MEIETPVTVSEADTDSLGHLNHVTVVRYLEKARYDWYARCGLFDDERDLGTVVVNINYDYRRECFLGDRLRVLSRGVSMGRRSMVVAHAIVRPDDTVAVEGRATSVVMDLGGRRIIEVPECVARHLRAADRDPPGP